MTIGKILAGVGLITSLAFVGCDDIPKYSLSQNNVDEVVENLSIKFEEECDNYLEVHSLLEEGKYEEAEKLLEEYLAGKNEKALEGYGIL